LNIEYMLKGQDLVVALKLAVLTEPTTYAGLALSLHLNASEVHTAVKRALHAQLLVDTGDFIVPKNSKLGNIDVHKQNLLEFVAHGAKYAFAAEKISMTVGVPTSHSAPVFQGVFAPGSDDWVWPYALGACKGVGIKPLHPCVPSAALADGQLYAALALLDALRVGRARERNMALPLLEALIFRNVNMTRAKELPHG
jgi:hypothetical protein